MAVLIDPPRWPAHGTRFSHLVSDSSLVELLQFADDQGILPRAFDHDHYDVPERRYAELVSAGALEVSPAELLRALVAGGLRVRPKDRTPKTAEVLPGLIAAWQELLPGAAALGGELLERWQEPHRRYHDVRHLAQVLAALTQICEGPASRPVTLAAWFHDAVYVGVAGRDEERSAALAESGLRRAGLPTPEVAEVARLVLLTVRHSPEPGDLAGAQLVDADLSILGQPPGRYHVYSRDVRLEYAHFDEELFATGRIRVLEGLLSLEPLFRTGTGQRLWSRQARLNLGEERKRWSRLAGTEQVALS